VAIRAYLNGSFYDNTFSNREKTGGNYYARDNPLGIEGVSGRPANLPWNAVVREVVIQSE
jgi:hypothetical protein